MLARLTLLLIGLPALALAADAGGDRSRDTRPAVLQTAALPTILPPAPASAANDPSQCRMGCAQTYYFCRAGDHPDNCAETWGQCVATCTSPNLAPASSTTP
jgi:hypothetical protein